MVGTFFILALRKYIINLKKEGGENPGNRILWQNC
nr:MAG TPA: hypothetical protein [Caudoviricetes sp.]DAQ23454.1 MAG TPA: hypothetical protein [Caudoviricetes sp.]